MHKLIFSEEKCECLLLPSLYGALRLKLFNLNVSLMVDSDMQNISLCSHRITQKLNFWCTWQ